MEAGMLGPSPGLKQQLFNGGVATPLRHRQRRFPPPIPLLQAAGQRGQEERHAFIALQEGQNATAVVGNTRRAAKQGPSLPAKSRGRAKYVGAAAGPYECAQLTCHAARCSG